MHSIVCLPGDGIGPEVIDQMKRVVAALGVSVEWIDMPAGESAVETHGCPLPQETLDAIREYKVAIKGPTTTPGGGGFKSVNVTLRQALDLYCGFRPVRSLPIPGTTQGVDLVIFRQNTEGLYLCKEVVAGEVGSREVTLTARFTEEAMLRLARRAFLFSRHAGRTHATIVNKENIHKEWGGMYHAAFSAIAADFPNVIADHMLVDAMGMRLVMNPGAYQVIVIENMFGDILSDVCAGLIGGLGVAAGANYGDRFALFEAVHGSAPDIAGKGIANPTAILLSSALMLEHIGHNTEAKRLRDAIDAIYSEGALITGDLARRYPGITPVGTEAFTDALIREIHFAS
ncbi:MAG: isocitrate/isopropylmalate family dehydrogenase [Candidatus Uhrbacteria bacterium]